MQAASEEVSGMTFDDMPALLMALQCTYTLILLTALFCIITVSIRMRRGPVSYIITTLLITGTYILYDIFVTIKEIKLGTIENNDRSISALRTVPEWIWLTLLISVTILGLLILKDVMHYGTDKLSSHSVKYAADDLSAGVCIYDNSGRILLMNETMARIGIEITGEYVLSGAQLWEYIQQKDNSPLRLSDGNVYTIRNEKTKLIDTELNEITAENITEEYLLTEQLRKVDGELIAQRKKLKELNALIEETTIQKEILAAKTRIHDHLGSTLIASKRFIRGNTEYTHKEITDMWLICLDLLQTAAEPEEKDTYEKVFTVAKYVGVEIKVNGQLPQRKQDSEVLVIAMIECLTNTFRHANGDLMILDCDEGEKYMIYTLSNNGEPPKTEISETGGLGNLRRVAENEGWIMEIQSLPLFRLTLKAPK